MYPKNINHLINTNNLYVVGGCVRDKLLGLEVNDFDYLVIGYTTEEMLKLGFLQKNTNFPVFIHPVNGQEYALARKEIKNGKGYHDFKIIADPSITVEEDLLRRDLTINALACKFEYFFANNFNENNIIDVTSGIYDIKHKIIRHNYKNFHEDPLRILRTLRFYAYLKPLNFTLDVETNNIIIKLINSREINYLNKNLIEKELLKVFTKHNIFFDYLKIIDEYKLTELVFGNYFKKIYIEEQNLLIKYYCDLYKAIDESINKNYINNVILFLIKPIIMSYNKNLIFNTDYVESIEIYSKIFLKSIFQKVKEKKHVLFLLSLTINFLNIYYYFLQYLKNDLTISNKEFIEIKTLNNLLKNNIDLKNDFIYILNTYLSIELKNYKDDNKNLKLEIEKVLDLLT